jgi:hypothetical protein
MQSTTAWRFEVEKLQYLYKNKKFEYNSPFLQPGVSESRITVYDSDDKLIYTIDLNLTNVKETDDGHSHTLSLHLQEPNVKGDIISLWAYLTRIKGNFLKDTNIVQYNQEDNSKTNATKDMVKCLFFTLNMVLNSTDIPELIYAHEWIAQILPGKPLQNIDLVKEGFGECFGFNLNSQIVGKTGEKIKTADGEVDATYKLLRFEFTGTKPYYKFIHNSCFGCIFDRKSKDVYVVKDDKTEIEIQRAYHDKHSEDAKNPLISFVVGKDMEHIFTYDSKTKTQRCPHKLTEYSTKIAVVLADYLKNKHFIPFEEPDDFENSKVYQ